MPENEKWTDKEIKALTAMRGANVNFATISEILGRSRYACQVKANKLGLVFGGRSDQGKEFVSESLQSFQELNSLQKGKIAEDLSTVKLVENGFDVFLPYTPQHRTDLAVIYEKKVCKIQVKAAVWSEKDGRFRVPLQRKDARDNSRYFYDALDIDFFVLYCLGINAVYVVPFELCSKHTGANLYPHRPKLQQKGFDWEIYRDSYNLIRDFLNMS